MFFVFRKGKRKGRKPFEKFFENETKVPCFFFYEIPDLPIKKGRKYPKCKKRIKNHPN